MKNLVEIIDSLCQWLEETVCPQITLLEPDDNWQWAEYEGLRVHPKVYPLFNPWPESEENPEESKTDRFGAPGIVVSVLEGHDNLKSGLRTLNIQLQLISWNPGQYGRDILYPIDDPSKPAGKKYIRKLDEWTYKRSQSGWKDSYIFLETVLRELENSEFINGMRVKLKEDGLAYGHYRDETGPSDLYPYWINYIKFDLEIGLNRPSKTYQEYL